MAEQRFNQTFVWAVFHAANLSPVKNCEASRMSALKRIFATRPAVIGMIHALPLPGTPRSWATIDQIAERACAEARIYVNEGVDAVMVENMHDIPFVKAQDMGPETVACMTRICSEVRREIGRHVPAGVQVLAAANKEAIAVAQAAHFDFVRVENFVFGHVADEGWLDGCAGSLLRYRKAIGATNILVLTDIKKKHASHAITSDWTLEQTAEAATFFGSDGLVLTGKTTGDPADIKELARLKASCGDDMPLIIGSGVTEDNMKNYELANGFIVGSFFKDDGKWENPIHVDHVKRFMKRHRAMFSIKC